MMSVPYIILLVGVIIMGGFLLLLYRRFKDGKRG